MPVLTASPKAFGLCARHVLPDYHTHTHTNCHLNVVDIWCVGKINLRCVNVTDEVKVLLYCIRHKIENYFTVYIKSFSHELMVAIDDAMAFYRNSLKFQFFFLMLNPFEFFSIVFVSSLSVLDIIFLSTSHESYLVWQQRLTSILLSTILFLCMCLCVCVFEYERVYVCLCLSSLSVGCALCRDRTPTQGKLK